MREFRRSKWCARGCDGADRGPAAHRVVRHEVLGGHARGRARARPQRHALGVGRVALLRVDLEHGPAPHDRAGPGVVAVGVVGVHGMRRVGEGTGDQPTNLARPESGRVRIDAGTGLELALRRHSTSKIRRWMPGSRNCPVGQLVQPRLPPPGRRRSLTHCRRTLLSLQPCHHPTYHGITNLPQCPGRSSLLTTAYPSSYLTNERDWNSRPLRPRCVRWLDKGRNVRELGKMTDEVISLVLVRALLNEATDPIGAAVSGDEETMA